MNISDAKNTEELFRLWKELRPDYTKFYDDGILLDGIWSEQKTKIAFLLKEPNDNFYPIRGRSYEPRNGNSKQFWRNVNMWSHTVKQLLNGEVVTFEDALARKEDSVGHIAYVNLKKKHEGRPASGHADIQAYVDRDWPLIEHQIRLVSPDVIFCCGTFRYIHSHLAKTDMKHGVFRWEGKTVIGFFHPSCRKGYRVTFDALSEMLKDFPSPLLGR